MHLDEAKTRSIIQLTVVIIIVIVLGFSTIALLKYFSQNPATSPQQETDKTALQQKAKSEYDNANNLLKQGKTEEAKKAFESAKSTYQQAGDTSHNKDIDTSLSLIEHTGPQTGPAQPPAPGTP